LPARVSQVACEHKAAEAADAKIKAEWTELAIEWHLTAAVNASDEKSESKSHGADRPWSAPHTSAIYRPMPGRVLYPAPVVRMLASSARMMRRGMPPPKWPWPPVKNIWNTSSPHLRSWLKPEDRCLVPFNNFAEYSPAPYSETTRKMRWLALNDDHP
jgi:putative SOS response-associated peptidase YedK